MRYIYIRAQIRRDVIIPWHKSNSYQLKELLDKFLQRASYRVNLVSSWPTLLFSFIMENEMDEMKGKSYLFEWVYICPVASYWTAAQLRRYPSFFFFFFWVTFLHRQLCNSILFEAAIFKFLARIPVPQTFYKSNGRSRLKRIFIRGEFFSFFFFPPAYRCIHSYF